MKKEDLIDLEVQLARMNLTLVRILVQLEEKGKR